MKRVLAVLTLVSLALVTGAGMSGLRLNLSDSYPGWWWVDGEPFHLSTARGVFVRLCFPVAGAQDEYLARGYLAFGWACEGTAPLVKRVFGVPGDTWRVSDEGVYVNDRLVPNTRPLVADRLGRSILHPDPAGGTIPPGYVLVLSDFNPRSFDGRYFGLVNQRHILNTVRPLWMEPPLPLWASSTTPSNG